MPPVSRDVKWLTGLSAALSVRSLLSSGFFLVGLVFPFQLKGLLLDREGRSGDRVERFCFLALSVLVTPPISSGPHPSLFWLLEWLKRAL